MGSVKQRRNESCAVTKLHHGWKTCHLPSKLNSANVPVFNKAELKKLHLAAGLMSSEFYIARVSDGSNSDPGNWLFLICITNWAQPSPNASAVPAIGRSSFRTDAEGKTSERVNTNLVYAVNVPAPAIFQTLYGKPVFHSRNQRWGSLGAPQSP